MESGRAGFISPTCAEAEAEGRDWSVAPSPPRGSSLPCLNLPSYSHQNAAVYWEKYLSFGRIVESLWATGRLLKRNPVNYAINSDAN